ncbi:FABP family protein [Tessaracoccus lubricantis]|uniref:FABP family protein n=1 Tax=Tessaracoccus lubricantis TaxID=545543 RepID=A0ABP9FJU6_9ACTN
MDLHPALQPLATLVGTWEGAGHGEYPNIRPYGYIEELTFTNIGKPFLVYRQRTWNSDNQLMHVETGYLRLPSPERVEFVLAQPTGQVELAEGHLEAVDRAVRIYLEGKILNTSTAKQVDATARRYTLIGDELATSFDMATGQYPIQRHLTSELTRSK